jgi:hypothetical protein
MRMKHEPPMFFAGNPTCPHCGTTYKMISDHFCPQGQQAKLDEYRNKVIALEAQLLKSTETLHDRIFCAALTGLISVNALPTDMTEVKEYRVKRAYEYADEALRQRSVNHE